MVSIANHDHGCRHLIRVSHADEASPGLRHILCQCAAFCAWTPPEVKDYSNAGGLPPVHCRSKAQAAAWRWKAAA